MSSSKGAETKGGATPAGEATAPAARGGSGVTRHVGPIRARLVPQRHPASREAVEPQPPRCGP